MERGTLQELQLKHLKKMEAMAKAAPTTTAAAQPAAPKHPSGAATVHPNVLRQQYDVVQYLMGARRAVGADELYAELGLNLAHPSSAPLRAALQRNERVAHDAVGDMWSYRPAHPVRDAAELLELVARYPDGIDGEELRDSYPRVADDVARLVAERKVLGIRTRERALPVLFPLPAALANAGEDELRVDADVRERWRALKLPEDFEIEQTLRTVGIDVVAPQQQSQQQSAGKRGGRRGGGRGAPARKRSRKVTNVHLLGGGGGEDPS